MTCIAAIESRDRVWLAADTGASSEDGGIDNAHGKIWKHSDAVAFGVAGAISSVQQVRYGLRVPRRAAGEDGLRWCITKLVPALKRAMREEPRDGEGQFDFEMIVAVDGRAFLVDPGLAVLPASRGYTAIGSGRDIALGSLFATKTHPPKSRVCRAVEAACAHNNACALPLEVLCVGGEP